MLRVIYIITYAIMCLLMLYWSYNSIVKKEIKVYVGVHRKITDKDKFTKSLGINYLMLSLCFLFYAILLYFDKTPKYPIFTIAFIILLIAPFMLVNKYTKK